MFPRKRALRLSLGRVALALLSVVLVGEVVNGHPEDFSKRVSEAELARREHLANKRHLAARSCASSINDFHISRRAKRSFAEQITFTGSELRESTCVTAPEIEEGPYYVNNELVRTDLVEDQEGVVITLDIGVIDTATCEPVPNAFVEIWSANATGFYGSFETKLSGGPPPGRRPGGGPGRPDDDDHEGPPDDHDHPPPPPPPPPPPHGPLPPPPPPPPPPHGPPPPPSPHGPPPPPPHGFPPPPPHGPPPPPPPHGPPPPPPQHGPPPPPPPHGPPPPPPPPPPGPPHRGRPGPPPPGPPGRPGGPGRGGPPPGSPSMTSNNTWLRGGYPTDTSGIVTLRTLYPGFYPGRTIHIHTMVHTDWSQSPNGTLISHSGTLKHIGQMFFDEDWNDRILKREPYSSNEARRTWNFEDHDFRRASVDRSSAIIEVEMLGDSLDDGLIGFITIGIDMTANYSIHSGNYYNSSSDADS